MYTLAFPYMHRRNSHIGLYDNIKHTTRITTRNLGIHIVFVALNSHTEQRKCKVGPSYGSDTFISTVIHIRCSNLPKVHVLIYPLNVLYLILLELCLIHQLRFHSSELLFDLLRH